LSGVKNNCSDFICSNEEGEEIGYSIKLADLEVVDASKISSDNIF
jgi:hypothetical protein